MQYKDPLLVTHHELGHCKTCLHKIDSVASPDLTWEQKPKAGDYVVCWYCGAISMMDEDFNFSPLTQDQLSYLKTEEPEAFEMIEKYSLQVKKR